MMLPLLTAALAATPPAQMDRHRAAEALEAVLDQSGARDLEALRRGVAEAVRALGPESETAQRLQRLGEGARFEGFLAGNDGSAWLVGELRPIVSDLRFEPVREAGLPAGFPELTPVGEIQLQRYPAYRMARTTMADASSTGAFFRLFGHIKTNDIPMTAPVEMTYDAGADYLDEVSMAFLYRSQEIGEVGGDASVEVVDVEPQVVVSLGLRGPSSAERVDDARRELERWLASHSEWKAAGPPRSMGHNGPSVSGDRRYFEVQIPVQPNDPTVIDFSVPQEAARWRPVDDAVMGGRSASRMEVDATGHCVFTGSLSLEKGGGFASVRRSAEELQLGDAAAVTLRVRGDGQRYRLRFRTDAAFDAPSYQADFDTVAGEWTEVTLELPDFELSWRGRRVADAPSLSTRDVRGLGLMIADKQAGAFRLELDSLRRR